MDNETLEIVKAEAERIRYTHAFELKQHAFRVAANEARIENLMNRRDMLAADGTVMAHRHANAGQKLAAVLARPIAAGTLITSYSGGAGT